MVRFVHALCPWVIAVWFVLLVGLVVVFVVATVAITLWVVLFASGFGVRYCFCILFELIRMLWWHVLRLGLVVDLVGFGFWVIVAWCVLIRRFLIWFGFGGFWVWGCDVRCVALWVVICGGLVSGCGFDFGCVVRLVWLLRWWVLAF